MLFATEALLKEHGKSIAGQRFVVQVNIVELNVMSYSLES